MRRINLLFVVRCLAAWLTPLFLCPLLLAQSQARPTRDSAALAVLNQAIVAMGASASVASLQSMQIQGHLLRVDSGENDSFTLSYLISNNGVRFRRSSTKPTGVSTFASGKGTPFLAPPNGKQETFGHHIAAAMLPYEHPSLTILLEIQNPNYSITMAPSARKAPIHIHTEDDSTEDSRFTSPQDWYFDSSTYLPIRVEYKLADVFHPSVTHSTTCRYTSFQTVGGVLVPAGIEVDENNIAVADITLDGFTFNVPLGDNFDMPGGN